MMEKHDKWKAYSAWTSVSFFWGTTYLAIRIGVETFPPALFAGIRFLLAGLVFVLVLRLRGYSFPNRRELLDIAVVGFALLVMANGTVVWASQWIPSSIAALVVATMPFFMVGLEATLPLGARVDARQVVGILVGFSGLALLLWPDLAGAIESAYLKGILALLFAAMSWGAGSVYSKYRKIRTAPLMAAAIQMSIAGALLVGIGGFFDEFARVTLNPKGLAALLYLLIFGSIVGYGSYIYVLDKLPTAFVSTYAYINPVIAVTLGWLILDERLDWLVALSTVIILAGVVIVKKASRVKPTMSGSVASHVVMRPQKEVC